MEERWREEGMEGEKGRKKEKSHYRQEIKCGTGMRRTEMALTQTSVLPEIQMWNTTQKGNPNEQQPPFFFIKIARSLHAVPV